MLLTRPGSDDVASRVSHLAVCDCVVKTPDFVLQLLPAFTQVRARHDLQASFRTSRQSQDRLRTILEFQPAVTCVIGPDGVLTAMNQAGLALLGAGREHVVGHPFMNFLPVAQRTAFVDAIRRVCLGESNDIEHTLVRPSGGTTDVRLRAVPFRSGDSVVALATIQERIGSGAVTDADAAASAAATAERERLLASLQQADAEAERLRAERARQAEERALLDAEQNESVAIAADALRHAEAELETLRMERADWAKTRSGRGSSGSSPLRPSGRLMNSVRTTLCCNTRSKDL